MQNKVFWWSVYNQRHTSSAPKVDIDNILNESHQTVHLSSFKDVTLALGASLISSAFVPTPLKLIDAVASFIAVSELVVCTAYAPVRSDRI